MKTYLAIRTLCKLVKILPQLSELRLWYPSINFGYEINLKVLMYLVLLDLTGYTDCLIGKFDEAFEEAVYFPSALVFVRN